MEVNRAQEIYESPTLINVSYQGQPVFIQDIHPSENKATISPLTDIDDKQDVEVDHLVEEGPTH
ncbi:H-type small acid-soluble spore protein [Alkalibacillus haloalkaliphilus]|uniref:H-type small acid-soluble spore protein n=1 Tax=Alkalibacillus haloalkaliphilus TaxID=94136 RepID=UPI0029363955|nr:H-type small acid-soluble spore protein [Alkalibacillus haloalkaliphilus]MDV2582774.1 H-type small acid-soluble spore protein [Alkalibacillus haloalkaliphilus]